MLTSFKESETRCNLLTFRFKKKTSISGACWCKARLIKLRYKKQMSKHPTKGYPNLEPNKNALTDFKHFFVLDPNYGTYLTCTAKKSLQIWNHLDC